MKDAHMQVGRLINSDTSSMFPFFEYYKYNAEYLRSDIRLFGHLLLGFTKFSKLHTKLD